MKQSTPSERDQLTQRLIAEMNWDDQYTVDTLNKILWATPTLSNYRLTKKGFTLLAKYIESFAFEIEFNYTGKEFLQLTKLRSPHFLSYKHTLGNPATITLFSPKVATQAKLYPSFNRYLELL